MRLKESDYAAYKAQVAQDLRRSLNESVTYARRRARDNDLDIDITVDDLMELWRKTDGRCVMSNKPMSLETGTVKNRNMMKVSIDRKDSTVGYTKNNIQLVCYMYNAGKNSSTDEETLEFWRSVINYQDSLKAIDA